MDYYGKRICWLESHCASGIWLVVSSHQLLPFFWHTEQNHCFFLDWLMHYIKCFRLLFASSTMKEIETTLVIFNTNATLRGVWKQVYLHKTAYLSSPSCLKFDFEGLNPEISKQSHGTHAFCRMAQAPSSLQHWAYCSSLINITSKEAAKQL